MSEPIFFTDGHTPDRNAEKLKVLNQILGAIFALGVVDTSNPVFYTDGCLPRRSATELEVLQKILGALIGLAGGGGGGGAFIRRTGADTATSTLTYASSLAIDFDGAAQQKVSLSGDIAFSTTNRGEGKFVSVRIYNPGPPRSISLGAGIRAIIGTFPATLATNKVAWITFVSNGATETDTDAAYQDEP